MAMSTEEVKKLKTEAEHEIAIIIDKLTQQIHQADVDIMAIEHDKMDISCKLDRQPRFIHKINIKLGIR